MSFNSDQLSEKIKTMEKDQARNMLISIVSSSQNVENKLKAAELLVSYEDTENKHIQDIKNVFLNDRHPQLRLKLIDLLPSWYEKEGIQFLKEQYKNCKDGSVRKNLIEKVGQENLNDSISFFIESLNDPDFEVKKQAIILLGKTDASEALIPLINILHFRNVEIYDSLINTIVKIGRKGNLHIINGFINTEDLYIKREIPVILGKIKKKESENILINFLQDQDSIIRKNSVKALDGIIEVKNVKYIIDLLKDQNVEVKKEAIQALGVIGSKKAIKPLIELLKENDTKLRNLAKNTLYKILKKSKSYEPIYEIVKGRNINARREAIKLLGMLKDVNAINLLMPIFNSQVPSLRSSAYRSILRIIDNKIDNKIINALSDKSWRIRMFCVKIVGEIAEPSTIDYLFNLIEDENGSVRNVVIDALVKFDINKVNAFATESLKNPNWKTRRAAVSLLLHTGSKESLDSLISCLNDEDVYIKSWAAMALGKLKDVDSIEPFIQLLKEKDDKIRISAIKALGEIGNKEAIKPLINILGDYNWDVRKEIENALNQIDPDWMSYL
ncbi:MAG: HEAT repeat domain-containing protein [Promethearchaeota archaeon]